MTENTALSDLSDQEKTIGIKQILGFVVTGVGQYFHSKTATDYASYKWPSGVYGANRKS